MHDTPFGLSDEEMDAYNRGFEDANGFVPPQIFFNGHLMSPVPHIHMEYNPPARNLGFIIENGRLALGSKAKERYALRYVWERIQKGRDYLSLDRMSRDTGFSYDDCERLVAQAHVDRKIPRMLIVEEVEG